MFDKVKKWFRNNLNVSISVTPERKRVYVDMDGVLCDYWKRFYELQNEYIKLPQTTYGFYTSLEPIPGAIESFRWLEERYDVYILTRPSYQNPLCYTEKRVWVEKHFGLETTKKLIICWDKELLRGDYLIDDHDYRFDGELIRFGTDEFRDWEKVKEYLKLKK